MSSADRHDSYSKAQAGLVTGLAEQSTGFDRIRALVDPGAKLAGLEDGWIAPIGVFRAPSGFEDAAWTTSVPITTLAYRLSGASIVSRTAACEGRRSGPNRNLALQPAGSANWATCDGSVRFAHIFVPDALIDRVAVELDRAPISQSLRDDLWFFADIQLDCLVSDYVLRSQAVAAPASRLEMEARSILVLERLVGWHHGPRKPVMARGGLAPRRLRQVTEYLEADFAADVSLAELTALTGLSSFHLCRAFKVSTGSPPHRWRQARRIERAREMLEGTDLSVTEIAAIVGYDDPGRLAAAFRKALGVTPTQYRRERRS